MKKNEARRNVFEEEGQSLSSLLLLTNYHDRLKVLENYEKQNDSQNEVEALRSWCVGSLINRMTGSYPKFNYYETMKKAELSERSNRGDPFGSFDDFIRVSQEEFELRVMKAATILTDATLSLAEQKRQLRANGLPNVPGNILLRDHIKFQKKFYYSLILALLHLVEKKEESLTDFLTKHQISTAVWVNFSHAERKRKNISKRVAEVTAAVPDT